MLKYADLVEQHKEELAALETIDNGKLYYSAIAGEVTSIADNIRYYAGAADKIHGKNLKMSGNYQAGIPDGVINVVTGFGSIAGATFTSHMDVDKVSFTGSTQTGRSVMQVAAMSNLKHVSLELGGKSPLIIFDDADVEKAANLAFIGAYVFCVIASIRTINTIEYGTRISKKDQINLVGVAPGTKRINTTKNINLNTREYPPIKVMQIAVVSTQGVQSYRLNLEDFPANARAYAYFAEIEDLKYNEMRKFKMEEPYMLDYSNAVVNIAENVNGSYTFYELSYMNVTLDFVLSFEFLKTKDSDRGPLLNAIEISRYVAIEVKTNPQDGCSIYFAYALLGDQK